MTKRAGELSDDEVERIVTIMNNPRQYKIPDWFLNRQKDVKDGKFSQVLANGLDTKMRDDLERLKKIRAHWGLRVRVNIRRRPDDVAALLVSPRRREANFQTKSTFPGKKCLHMSTKNCCASSRAIRKEIFVIFRLLFLRANFFFKHSSQYFM